jgi:hypothetical protein
MEGRYIKDKTCLEKRDLCLLKIYFLVNNKTLSLVASLYYSKGVEVIFFSLAIDSDVREESFKVKVIYITLTTKANY